jgi:hypothetical protein
MKGHKVAKVNIMAETLYVKHSRNGHARLEPSLPVSLLLDDMLLIEMLSKDHSLKVWTAQFDLLKAEKAGGLKRSSTTSFGSGSPWEEVEIPNLESLQEASESFKTPKKLRLGHVLRPDSIPVTSRPQCGTFSSMSPLDINDEDLIKRSKIQRALQTIMSEWNQWDSILQLIYMEFDRSGSTELRFQNSIAKTLGEIQGAI